MPRKDDPKYEIYQAAVRAKEEEKRNQEVTMTVHKLFLPIPEVDIDGWEHKIAVREAAEAEAGKIRHYLLREWRKVSRQQAIVVVYPYVRYINNRVTYKVELTTYNSKRYKEWLREACGRYAEEKS
jgi:hypothetical protein